MSKIIRGLSHRLLSICAASAFCLLVPELRAAIVPRPVGLGQQERFAQHRFTGVLSNSLYYGSGVVAKHRKLVISCAHVTYEGKWLENPYWSRAWNALKPPDRGLLLNGYVYWSSYSSAVRQYGMESNQAYASDLVAFYSYSSDTAAGQFAECSGDGIKALKSSSQKLITGYPMGRYGAYDQRRYQLHETGYFNTRFYDDYGRYLGADGVETGPGNSGGPVWVFEGERPLLAGILVSGLERQVHNFSSVGVVGLDAGGWQLISSALDRNKVVARNFPNNIAGPVPDPGTLKRSVSVSGMPRVTRSLQVSLELMHPKPADLVVTLRSPTNRSITLFDGTREKAGSRILIKARRFPIFETLNPNGEWVLSVRDRAKQGVGNFNSVALAVAAN